MVQKAQESFDLLKAAYTSAPLLIMPDTSQPFILETDASNFAVGGFILQEGDDGQLHPLAYYSKKMTPAECNYPIYNKELLAIMKYLNHWRI